MSCSPLLRTPLVAATLLGLALSTAAAPALKDTPARFDKYLPDLGPHWKIGLRMLVCQRLPGHPHFHGLFAHCIASE